MLLLSEDPVIIEVTKPVNVEDFKKQFCMLCSVAGNVVVPSEGDRLWISVGSPRPLPLITLCIVLSQMAVLLLGLPITAANFSCVSCRFYAASISERLCCNRCWMAKQCFRCFYVFVG